jgi:hypothetical protein
MLLQMTMTDGLAQEMAGTIRETARLKIEQAATVRIEVVDEAPMMVMTDELAAA